MLNTVKFLTWSAEGNVILKFGERGEICFVDDAIPMVQRNSRIGMLASELDQPFSRNDMHTRLIYLDLRYWSNRG